MSKIPTPEVSPLFIDKISLTGNPAQDAIEFRGHADTVFAIWKTSGRAQEGFKKHGSRYKVAYTLLDGNKKLCLVQLDPVIPKHAMFRLAFNPKKLGTRGRRILHEHLTELFLADYDKVMAGVKITAMDVTVEVTYVEFSALMVTENWRRGSGVWGKTFDKDGRRTHTYYLGAPRSNEQVEVYDKKEEGIATTGRDPGQLITRVEVSLIPRIRNADGKYRSGIYLHELRTLPNAFARVQLSSLPAAEKYSNDYRWKLFLGCCEAKGVQGALGGLPDNKRSRYLKRVNKGGFGWWQPTAIWKGLQTALKTIGIFPDSAFEKPAVHGNSGSAIEEAEEEAV